MSVRKITKEEMRLEKVGVPTGWFRFTIAGRALRLSPTVILRLQNIVNVEMNNRESFTIGHQFLVTVEAIIDREGEVDHIHIKIYQMHFISYVLLEEFAVNYNDFMEVLNTDLRKTDI